jgi:hypothetical protein
VDQRFSRRTTNYGYITGGNNGVDTYSDKNIAIGTFATQPYLQGSSAGALGAGTRNVVGLNLDMTAGGVIASPYNNRNQASIPALAANSTTPSVTGSLIWQTFNSSPTTITNFTNGSYGTLAIYVGDANTTFAQTANIKLCAGNNTTAPNGSVLMFLNNNGQWTQVCADSTHRSGSCKLVGGTCSSSFSPAYAVAPYCVANGQTSANAMKVTATTSAVTVTSSSGTDAQAVTWSCGLPIN